MGKTERKGRRHNFNKATSGDALQPVFYPSPMEDERRRNLFF